MTSESKTIDRLESVAPPTIEEPALRQKPFEVVVFNRDPELRIFLDKALVLGNVSITNCVSREEVESTLHSGACNLILVGIDSPETMELLSNVVRSPTQTPVVAVARRATPELVREVMKSGVADFLFGSMDVRSVLPRLLSVLEAGRTSSAPVDESLEIATTVSGSVTTNKPEDVNGTSSVEDCPIISCSNVMQRVIETAETVAPTQSTVLIQGESGTGKEVIAKHVHRRSTRGGRPFVEVNCGALPDNLLESQLFGHERGSFTGAVQRQIGLFEVADKSTIFLDEIGEMSPDMQVKLLRVLQFREFRRIGGSHVTKVDVRVIAATNKDLMEEVKAGNFRADLFYRINVICLAIPPLRDRVEEIPRLVEFFAQRLTEERQMASKMFSEEAVQKLQKYRWTGNVRELENAVERLLLLGKGDTITGGDVEEHLDGTREPKMDRVFAPTLTLDEVKKIHIANVLRVNEGNKMKTARMLKINVKTLYNLIKNLNIET